MTKRMMFEDYLNKIEKNGASPELLKVIKHLSFIKIENEDASEKPSVDVREKFQLLFREVESAYWRKEFPKANLLALFCMSDFYLILESSDVKLEPDAIKDNRLGYLEQCCLFKLSYIKEDYVECCRQLEAMLVFYDFTFSLKQIMLYLLHELFSQILSVNHQLDGTSSYVR